MANKIRVGLVFGGKSGEHEVSLASAHSVLSALDKDKYEPVLIGVTKEGRWLMEGNPLKQLMSLTRSPLLKAENIADGTRNGTSKETISRSVSAISADRVLDSSVDVVFPLIHGPYGEDGTVQGLFELANIPYVGAGVAASAVGMDKALMKAVFQAAGLPVAHFLVFLRVQWEQEPEVTIQKIEQAIGYPCFVKPANLGSSVGVTKAHNWDELTQALTTAAQFDRKIIVEKGIIGREVECSVLGNDEPVASIPGEIVPGHEFYDYDAKYADESGTRLLIPAELSPEQVRTVQDLAIRAFKVIDCAGMARVDFFIQSSDGQVIVNEINTIPGFTSVSMYPKLWEASGLAYPRLIERLIELALERHQDKNRNPISR
ncbi:MAG: D-alanine--D-alanine ligase [Anaerolineae bacterium]